MRSGVQVMRHDSGVQAGGAKSSHPVTIDSLGAEAALRGDNAYSRTRLPACSSSTTANAQWWPVSQPKLHWPRGSSRPAADLIPIRRLARPRRLSRRVRAYRPTGWQSPSRTRCRIPAIRPGVSRELASRSVAWAPGFPKISAGTACLPGGKIGGTGARSGVAPGSR